MVSVAEAVVMVLEPYVGRTVADTCVRATALSIGKPSDELTVDDLVHVEANARRLLSAALPRTKIDELMQVIEEEVGR